MNSGKKAFINPLNTPLPRLGSERKLKILLAAEEVFSSKGFKEATVTEIAAAVGVQESVLYRYFKGKEDLLFSIIEERLIEGLALLDRDLQGLNEPKSRLRKMMWGNLWYQEAYSAYSRLLFFECRPNTAFYSSPAFGRIRQYLGRLTDILKEGIQQGVFRGDTPLTLMEEMVLGLLDMITIGFHLLNEVTHPVDDFEDAAALIERIFAPARDPEKETTDKREGILRAAEKIFARKEFAKAKMTDIARQAGVGDGTVYEYFPSKELLLYAIPQRHFARHLQELTEVTQSKKAAGQIKRTLQDHYHRFMTDPDFLRIFVFNLYLNPGFYRSEAYGPYREYYRLLERLIEEAKTLGAVRPEIHPRILRYLLVGPFCWTATRWYSSRKRSEIAMKKEIDLFLDRVLQAVLVEEEG